MEKNNYVFQYNEGKSYKENVLEWVCSNAEKLRWVRDESSNYLDCECKIEDGLTLRVVSSQERQYLQVLRSYRDFRIYDAKDYPKINDILQKIIDGEICNISEIDGFTYIDYTREINEAFKYRHSLLANQVERNLEVIMITGSSGSGKTTLAKRICKEKGIVPFVSSSSNDPFDGYKNNLSKIVILDDLRPSVMALSDLLKVTDNHINSTVRARYHNISLNCELIIITTVLKIDEFFRQVFENEQEPVTQFKRRIGTYIVMDKHTIRVQKWDDLNMCYSKPVVYSNDTLIQFEVEKVADNRTPKEQIEQLLPFLSGKELTKTKPPKTSKPEKSEKPKEIIDDEIFGKMIKMTDI